MESFLMLSIKIGIETDKAAIETNALLVNQLEVSMKIPVELK